MPISQHLFHAATTRLRCSCASLHVAQDNLAALALYRSMGFQEDAVLHDYLAPGQHSLRMLLDDLPHHHAGEAPPCALLLDERTP